MRTTQTASAAGLHRIRVRGTADRRAADTAGTHPPGVPVLDVIYLALTLALFALVGLIAKGAEKL